MLLFQSTNIAELVIVEAKDTLCTHNEEERSVAIRMEVAQMKIKGRRSRGQVKAARAKGVGEADVGMCAVLSFDALIARYKVAGHAV